MFAFITMTTLLHISVCISLIVIELCLKFLKYFALLGKVLENFSVNLIDNMEGKITKSWKDETQDIFP